MRQVQAGSWKVLVGALLSFSILMTASIFWIGRVPQPLFPVDYSTVVLDEDGRYLRVFLNSGDQWILPPDGSNVPAKLKTAVLHYEDKRFASHPGIDPLALGRALYQNIRHGGTISGASTITMQAARLMQPKKRTVLNKLREMAQALVIEIRYSKDEILQMYLDHAPYGGNVIGYRTASLRYFGKEAENLSWAEAATLAVLPNNPARVNPNRNQDLLKEKRDGLLWSLFTAELIDETTLQLGLAEPIAKGNYAFPVVTPHLAEQLARTVDADVISTTINLDVQKVADALLREHVASQAVHGIVNGAVLIADTKTGAVKAYVASQDYYDDEHLGKIDGVMMRRSAGSTLKPFLYGLAMDEGLIVPQSMLLDVPTSYGGYTPYNADQGFSGVVRACDALIRSLNVPAVALLDEYGVVPFYEFLDRAGLHGLGRSPEEHGLSLILGSPEVSLWELGALYRGLGNYGSFSNLYVVRGSEPGGEQQLLSPGSAYLVLDILAEVRRPGLEAHWRELQSSRPLAWKTGTSFGSRDAWAVGVSPSYTIAVWMGNFAGGSIKGMTGVDTAAPLLLRLLSRLEQSNGVWFRPPTDGLQETLVSALTGYRLLEDGPHMTVVQSPSSAKPLKLSPYEATLFVTQDGQYQVCSLCWDREDLKVVEALIYPSHVPQASRVPPHNPHCPGVQSANPIRFVYPQSGSRIFVPRDMDGQYQRVALEVAHASQGSGLFWYLDGTYLGITRENHRMLVALEPGWHKLYVVDGMGNNRELYFFSERASQ